jgi:peptide/nickel transport system substrate-binding protein
MLGFPTLAPVEPEGGEQDHHDGSHCRAVTRPRPRPRPRTPGRAARWIILALVLTGCDVTVPPSMTLRPTVSPPPPTAIPSQGPFSPAAYPTDGEAPCGQDEAPDVKHAAYRGNLKRISAPDAGTVTFELCRPDVAFLTKIATPAFAINDSRWLAAHIDRAETTQPIVTEVNGTGPYRLERWDHGSEISLARNDAYWGEPARNERLIVRWRDMAGQRVVELQGATVDGVDQLDAGGVATVEADVNLQLETRPGLDMVYLGFTSTFAPFGDERVRRALAMGIDRKKLVDQFFPAGSQVATHATPCTIPFGCTGSPWYDYDPLQAKELLAAAGFPNGFDTTIRYRAAARSSLPDPTGLATALQQQLLDNLGIRATPTPEPDDTYGPDLEAGKLDGIHLHVQPLTYPDVSAFLDPQFGSPGLKEFGPPRPDLIKALGDGRSSASHAAREAAYARANDIIRAGVPLIPIGQAGSASAYRVDVEGAAASALGLERFDQMVPGDRRQLVWLTTGEPPGLYCADETDPIATLVCAQVSEGLYGYEPGGADVTPVLARSCNPSDGLKTWTCKLRTGVRFHDGSTLDAGDVVASFAAQWDAEHPLHAGRDGSFAHMAWLGGLLNPPATPH